MKLNGKEISTVELEKMFYTNNPDDLIKVRDALSEEFKDIEAGDNMLRSYVTDNLTQADKMLNTRTGLYGIMVRATEFADAALDYYENYFFEQLRLEDEKKVTEHNKKVTDPKKEDVLKKQTDSVIKAQAAVKCSTYRRFRNYLRGYLHTCEKSMASLRSSVAKCQSEAYLAQKANYRPQEKVNDNNDDSNITFEE